MKRVLFICNYEAGSGGISVQAGLLNRLIKEDGYESDIFTTKGSLIFRVLQIFKLLMIGGEYDVFHIHGCSYRGFFPIVVGVLVGKILRKKIIVTYHGGDAALYFAKSPGFVRFFLCRTDVNIVLSGYLGSVFEAHNLPYIIIPNIIDFDKSEFEIRDEIQPQFISVRSLHELYNIQCIIDAFANVKSHYPTASLTIIGDGPQKSYLEKKVLDLNLKDVKFIGQVDNNAIYSYLKKADIFLSAPKIDNQPVSILEAFNAGLLVISSRVGGVPYMIEHAVNGYLFESENVNELAAKMMLAVTDQQQSKQLIINAYKSLDLYKWGSVKTKLFELY